MPEGVIWSERYFKFRGDTYCVLNEGGERSRVLDPDGEDMFDVHADWTLDVIEAIVRHSHWAFERGKIAGHTELAFQLRALLGAKEDASG